MQNQEFLEKVRKEAGLRDEEEAQRASEAVFEALRARVSHGTGDEVAVQLPRELRQLWESGILEHIARAVSGFERLDLDEFLIRVRDTADLDDAQQAERATRAVFRALHEQIAPASEEMLLNELPADIRRFWEASATASMRREEAPAQERIGELPPETEGEEEAPMAAEELPPGQYDSTAIGPSAAEVFRSAEQIRREIEELLEANTEVDASQINVEVHQGRVTLRGAVASPVERDAAAHVAAEALGAIEVNNELAARGQ